MLSPRQSVIIGPTDIIRPIPTTGTSVVLGGRGAGGSLVTTGIIGQIDIITDRMDTTGRLVASESNRQEAARKYTSGQRLAHSLRGNIGGSVVRLTHAAATDCQQS